MTATISSPRSFREQKNAVNQASKNERNRGIEPVYMTDFNSRMVAFKRLILRADTVLMTHNLLFRLACLGHCLHPARIEIERRIVLRLLR